MTWLQLKLQNQNVLYIVGWIVKPLYQTKTFMGINSKIEHLWYKSNCNICDCPLAFAFIAGYDTDEFGSDTATWRTRTNSARAHGWSPGNYCNNVCVYRHQLNIMSSAQNPVYICRFSWLITTFETLPGSGYPGILASWSKRYCCQCTIRNGPWCIVILCIKSKVIAVFLLYFKLVCTRH